MKVRKSLIVNLEGSMQELKILALALYLKYRLQGSMLKHYNPNRLSKKAKVNYKTLVKYIPLLLERDLMHFEGTGKNTILIINKLSSNNTKNNYVNIEKVLNFESFRTTIKSLRAFMIMRIQAKKEKTRQLLHAYNNPQKGVDYRSVRKRMKRLVRLGFLKDLHQQYHEYGLSLEKIAMVLGCCIVTGYRAVNYAIDNSLLERQHHVEQIYAKGVGYMPVPWATFTTKNNIYVVHANTYTLTPTALSCFPDLHPQS